MPRNLDKRVEIMFPVEEERIKEEILHILMVQLEDNRKAHILQPDGTYEKADLRGKMKVCSQEQFCEEAAAAVRRELAKQEPENRRTFQPEEPRHNRQQP